MQGFWYLASPYTHHLTETRIRRWRAVRDLTAAITIERIPVYSPIVHGASLELVMFPEDMGQDIRAFWWTQDKPMLDACSTLMVYTLDGWETSKGVADEIAYAKSKGIPIDYIPAIFDSIDAARSYIRHTHLDKSPAPVVCGREVASANGVNPPSWPFPSNSGAR